MTLLKVRRQCLVCDWAGEAEEPDTADAIGTPCDACHAPTERVAILGRRAVLASRNRHAAELGRLGGLRGGPARAAALSPERRREIARLAAQTRWRREQALDS